MNRAYKFRIEPNKEQRILFAKTFGCCRFLYNQMLHDRKTAYLIDGRIIYPRPAMYKDDYPWLKEVDSLALANVQLNLEKAYSDFLSRPEIGHPKFKAKHHSRQSYATNRLNNNIRIDVKKKRIRLPKVGYVKVRIHRSIPENYELKSVTVSREPSGKYYASILFEIPESENQARGKEDRDKEYLGIDYAMSGLAVLSTGERAEYPGFLRKAEEKLAREQRKLSHCEKGSRNYVKQKRKVALVHEKIRNQRKDFLHKLSRRLADSYDVIGVEDIDMKAMSQTLRFGKSVMDNGYGMFRTMLSYKLEEQGKALVKVDRFFPSSKTCSICGQIKEELPLSERTYTCSCGNCMDRDVNAAINIRNEARRMNAA